MADLSGTPILQPPPSLPQFLNVLFLAISSKPHLPGGRGGGCDQLCPWGGFFPGAAFLLLAWDLTIAS